MVRLLYVAWAWLPVAVLYAGLHLWMCKLVVACTLELLAEVFWLCVVVGSWFVGLMYSLLFLTAFSTHEQQKSIASLSIMGLWSLSELSELLGPPAAIGLTHLPGSTVQPHAPHLGCQWGF